MQYTMSRQKEDMHKHACTNTKHTYTKRNKRTNTYTYIKKKIYRKKKNHMQKRKHMHQKEKPHARGDFKICVFKFCSQNIGKFKGIIENTCSQCQIEGMNVKLHG